MNIIWFIGKKYESWYYLINRKFRAKKKRVTGASTPNRFD